MKFALEKKIAIDSVLKASLVTRRIQKNLINQDISIKDDKSPVTIADFAAQVIVIQTIKNQFPNDEFIAEER